MQMKELQIEGFRGVNQLLSIPLGERVTVVSGPNGSGKTSIFQAIEWCLFGRLDFSGTEFQREDAIVNDFHPGDEARVILTLDDGAVITRTRRKKARTGFGKRDSQLTLIQGGREFGGEEAQALISDLLDLKAEEFGAVAHLRQETIRSFIQGTPVERSRTIDKMIGLFHLRELITGLDLQVVDKEINQLEKRVTDIERTMIQATILSREIVRKQEDTLQESGIPHEIISEVGVFADLQAISDQLIKLATDLGVPAPALDMLSAETARRVTNQAKAAVRELGEGRFASFSQTERTISRLTQLLSELERAIKDSESVAGTDVGALTAQRDAAVARKSQYQGKLTKLNTRFSNLNRLQRQIAVVEAALQQTARHLQSLGSIEEAEMKLSKIRNEMETVVSAGKTARALETLLPAAVEYLETAQPDRCPVCQQAISDLQAVVHGLQQEVQASDEARKAQALENRWRALKEAEREQEQLIAEIRKTGGILTGQQEELEVLKADLKGVTGTIPIEQLADFVEQQLTTVTSEIASVQQEISKAGVEIATADTHLRNLKEEQEQLQRYRKQIAKELDIPLGTEDLTTPLHDCIKRNRQKLKRLEGLANAFPTLNGTIDRVERILEVLEARERLAELEDKYPTAMSEKEALLRAISELNDLKLGLQDIYQAATEHQRSVVSGALAALQPVINERYSRIMGHPEYAELQIEPEEQKKGVFRYWIAARNSAGTHSTYITTRFSTSQRNVVAVAIFLAMAEHLPHNLNVLMMDDPTQSMDPEHQRAMAQFLAEEGANRQVIVATEDPAFAKMIIQSSQNPLHCQLESWATEGTTVR